MEIGDKVVLRMRQSVQKLSRGQESADGGDVRTGTKT